MNKKQILQELEGQEIYSLTFEGVVGIYNGQVIQAGKVKHCSAKQAKQLLKDAFYDEFGTYDVSKVL